MDDAADWVIVALTYVALTVMYGSALLILVLEVVDCFRRWRSRRHNSLAVDRLMESVDDVPYYYHRLPAGDGNGEDDRCVICLAEYEQGEGCFVLPGCAHTFHRSCIASWLHRGNNSCPVCRATAMAASCISAEHHQQSLVDVNPAAAAENIV